MTKTWGHFSVSLLGVLLYISDRKHFSSQSLRLFWGEGSVVFVKIILGCDLSVRGSNGSWVRDWSFARWLVG